MLNSHSVVSLMLEWLVWNCSSDFVCGQMIDWERGFIVNWWNHAWRCPVILLFSEVPWKNALDMNLLLVIWNMSESHYYLCSLRAGCQDLVFWNNRKLSSQARSKKQTPLIGQFILNTGLLLVQTDHVTWILASYWSRQVTWHQYWPLIGRTPP